jgi:ligand-binding SRPBCC domain-containing protein
MNFHVAAERPLTIQAGTKIDYKLRIHGLPLCWQSLISVWEPPVRFVDEQLRGPYRMWHHEHRFSDENGGTLAADEVHYRVPGGRLVNRLFVAPDLRKVFSYRTQKLQEIFGASR